MDILKVKDNMIIYSYRNGLKTSLCSDLVALVYNKPNIWLIFKNEEVLVHVSMLQIESVLQNNFTRIIILFNKFPYMLSNYFPLSIFSNVLHKSLQYARSLPISWPQYIFSFR